MILQLTTAEGLVEPLLHKLIARGIHICESWIKTELCKRYLCAMYYYIHIY